MKPWENDLDSGEGAGEPEDVGDRLGIGWVSAGRQETTPSWSAISDGPACLTRNYSVRTVFDPTTFVAVSMVCAAPTTMPPGLLVPSTV